MNVPALKSKIFAEIIETLGGDAHSACRQKFEPYLNDICDAINKSKKTLVCLLFFSVDQNSWGILTVRKVNRKIEAICYVRAIPLNIDLSYAADWNSNDDNDALTNTYKNSFEHFSRWLDDDDAMLDFLHNAGTGDMYVKLDPECLSAVHFPFVGYQRRSFHGFGNFGSIVYIVTEKTFTETATLMTKIERDLCSIEVFFKNLAVIVNTYPKHRQDPRCLIGTSLLINVLDIFTEISISNQKLGLKWYVNPCRDTLKELFANKAIKYYLGNFECKNNIWELGRGNRLSSDQPESAPNRDSNSDRLFSPDDCGDLSHINLLRLFHCNAIFDWYLQGDTLPGDTSYIARALLDKGAKKVEGGLTRESYLDFVRYILNLLSSPGAYGNYMNALCYEKEIDAGSINHEINSFLNP